MHMHGLYKAPAQSCRANTPEQLALQHFTNYHRSSNTSLYPSYTSTLLTVAQIHQNNLPCMDSNILNICKSPLSYVNTGYFRTDGNIKHQG
jgi:hypothetical protein